MSHSKIFDVQREQSVILDVLPQALHFHLIKPKAGLCIRSDSCISMKIFYTVVITFVQRDEPRVKR